MHVCFGKRAEKERRSRGHVRDRVVRRAGPHSHQQRGAQRGARLRRRARPVGALSAAGWRFQRCRLALSALLVFVAPDVPVGSSVGRSAWPREGARVPAPLERLWRRARQCMSSPLVPVALPSTGGQAKADAEVEAATHERAVRLDDAPEGVGA